MKSRNVDLLRNGGYKSVIGARIKNQKANVSEWIKTLPHVDGLFHEYILDNSDRLIVTYNSKRAAKDACNRRKGVDRLQKAFASGKITKDKINKRGYNKFLTIEKNVEVTINEEKIAEDDM